MMKPILTVFLLAISLSIYSQTEEYPYPSLSPKGIISQTVGNTIFEIEYERPSARKRVVFGNLVPWNKVWRTGAGHCTKISFDKDVVIEGQSIDAGKYSLFTIPSKEEWIVILNKDTTLYGSYDYNYEKDSARFIVIPTNSSRYYETLNFDIEIIPNNAKIFLNWANHQISFTLETTTDDKVKKLIAKDLLTNNNKDSDIYAGASEYLYYKGEDLANALELCDTAIALNKNNGWARSLKVRIYEKLKLYDNAIAELKLSIENTESREDLDKVQKENILHRAKLDLSRIAELKE